MSTTLGSIHQWMYGKIMVLEQMIQADAALARKEGWQDSAWGRSLDDYVKTDFPPLDEVIDLSNIHGSISGMIDDAEERYAELITGLLKDHPERMSSILDEAYRFGARFETPSCSYTDDALRIIRDHVLDGMPCDRTFDMYTTGDGSMHVDALVDLHSRYWESCGGDPENYYALRTRYIQGLLKDSGYQFSSTGEGKYLIFPVAEG